jgi:hypothetical protein
MHHNTRRWEALWIPGEEVEMLELFLSTSVTYKIV